MEKFIINFLNYLISDYKIYGWRDFNVSVLLSNVPSNLRPKIINGSKIPIGDSNWNSPDHVNAIQQFLENNKLAEILPDVESFWRTMRFTDNGRKMLELGSVENYLIWKRKQEELRERLLHLNISNLDVQRKLTWFNFWIAMATIVTTLTTLDPLIRNQYNSIYPIYHTYVFPFGILLVLVFLILGMVRRLLQWRNKQW